MDGTKGRRDERGDVIKRKSIRDCAAHLLRSIFNMTPFQYHVRVSRTYRLDVSNELRGNSAVVSLRVSCLP